MEAVILSTHVVAGIISLVTGLMALLMRKGGIAHEGLGKIYFAAMTIIFFTGTYVSSIQSNYFLLLIGFFSYYLVFTGLRYNKVKVISNISFIDVLTSIIFIFSFFGMYILAFIAVMQGVYSFGIVTLVFALIGSSLMIRDVKFYVLKHPLPHSKVWIREHIGRMVGSYIAASTAFLVNNIHVKPEILVWLGPTALGIFLIMYFNKRYA
jgi:uncharacterized membrane protein